MEWNKIEKSPDRNFAMLLCSANKNHCSIRKHLNNVYTGSQLVTPEHECRTCACNTIGLLFEYALFPIAEKK